MKKRLGTLLIILSLVLPASFLPIFIPTPRAHALIGIVDVNLESIPTVVGIALNAIAKVIAQRMVDETIKDTINWANSGFEGNPAYVTDFGQYLTSTADAAAGDYLNSELGFLCSPFANSVRLSLNRNYYSGANIRTQCTLSDIGGNIEDFFHGNFSAGGWETWFEVTQNNANNPYGAYLEAKVGLDNRVANALNIEQDKLQWSSGVLSSTECEDSERELLNIGADGIKGTADDERGQCKPGKGVTKTPGTIIKGTIENSFAAPLNSLISVDSLDDLVSAFLNGILNRYVFSSKGLLSSDGTDSGDRELIDLDGDHIPDGWDYDNNGILDICSHGSKDKKSPPSNTNCIQSLELGDEPASSPYFIPICREFTTTKRDLEDFSKFLHSGVRLVDLGPETSRVWVTQFNSASDAVGRLTGTLERYKVEIAYIGLMSELSKYAFQLDIEIAKLVKDNRLRNPAGGEAEWDTVTLNLLNYLGNVQVKMGDCENPDLEGIEEVNNTLAPPPFTFTEGGTFGTSTTTNSGTGTNGNGAL